MVSSKDIAKKAGVSQSTVSRVINTPSSVRKEKREIVERVMKELNYRPDSVARSLISNKTNQISLISGTLNNPFFVETTKKIINYAYLKGFNVNVYFEEDFPKDDLYNTVFSQRTEGIILSSMYFDSPYFNDLVNLGVPYIMFNRKHEKGGNFVELNNYQAGEMATDHLIEKGHSDIHWFGGELEKSTFRGRYDGFCHSMNKHNREIAASNISITLQNPIAIEEELSEVLSKRKRPTAIFAATDMIAMTIMDVLQRKGFSIPEDIALIGIDNTELSQHSSFDITSIGLEQGENLGEIAIKYLIDQIEDQGKRLVQKTYPCQLYERGTV